MAETFTRQQLHDLIWSSPMREVSKRLGMSDVGLRKHCIKAFVPPPPQGHWNRVHAGQSVKVIPLPPRPPGVPDEISIGRDDYRNYNQRILETEPVPPVFAESIEDLRSRVAKNLGIVVASKNLSPPHIAFRREVEDDARRKLTGSAWDPPILDTPLEKRRLRILQGLFNGLSRLDCVGSAYGKDVRALVVTVGQQQVRLTLDRIQVSRQRSRSIPAHGVEARLKLTILKGNYDTIERLSWMDSEEARIETLLSEIATEIIVSGELQYREHKQRQYDAHIKHREELRQAAIKRKLEQEKAERDRLLKLEADRLKRLFDSAESHRKANDIRDFVASVLANPAASAGERVARWQEWALAQADMIDPLATGRIWDDISDTG
jgi:hypothetical protein